MAAEQLYVIHWEIMKKHIKLYSMGTCLEIMEKKKLVILLFSYYNLDYFGSGGVYEYTAGKY